MAEEPDVIRQQIDETRSSLTEKLETLEGQVRGTVQEAKASVEGTIQNVKDTVHDTVATVKRTFDVRYQTERHPWAMVGGSVLAGFMLGSLAGGRRSPGRRATFDARGGRAEYSLSSLAAPEPRRETAPEAAPSPSPSASRPSFLSKVLHQFDGEIEQLKGIAVGALVGVVRDLVKQSVPPSLSGQLESVLDSATTKLGGKPVPGPVLNTGERSGGYSGAGEARRGAYGV